MVDVINLACGGHAGDPVTMRRTVALAKKHNVKIGARKLTSNDGDPDDRPRLP
jgi:lactam utilization protein B